MGNSIHNTLSCKIFTFCCYIYIVYLLQQHHLLRLYKLISLYLTLVNKNGVTRLSSINTFLDGLPIMGDTVDS